MFGIIIDSSSQTCGTCGATPRIINNLDDIWNHVQKAQTFDIGVSTLHAWIRCFEALLHISYRLDIKKWQIRDSAEKVEVNERKELWYYK